jgi:hypothetical protein
MLMIILVRIKFYIDVGFFAYRTTHITMYLNSEDILWNLVCDQQNIVENGSMHI